ncbi:MAG: patatin family protein [Muribaculaceae bacterium]
MNATTGLVLEGGGMRGMYTAGVLDVMMENHIEVNRVVGVSAGAVFGCNYKSKQIGRVIRYNAKYCNDSRYISLKSLITTGDLYNVKFCYHDIPERLDPFDTETYSNNYIDFFATCTDVESGKAVYQNCKTGRGNDTLWLQASASMPFVARIVEIDGNKYLDGGIADSIPIKWMRECGVNRNIIVLTQPNGYRKKKSPMARLMKLFYHRYPDLIEAMANRHAVYNETLDYISELEKGNDTLVIRPSRKINISRTERNPNKLWDMYNLGRNDATERINGLIEFTKK